MWSGILALTHQRKSCLPYEIILIWNNVVQNKTMKMGSAKANRSKPKTGLGRVFNFKLGGFDNSSGVICVDARPHL